MDKLDNSSNFKSLFSLVDAQSSSPSDSQSVVPSIGLPMGQCLCQSSMRKLGGGGDFPPSCLYLTFLPNNCTFDT